jgi:hypothetical protein
MALFVGQIVSFALLIRGEILPEKLQNKLHLSALPSLSFWQWTTFAAILFVLFVLEGAYQYDKGLREELEKTQRGGIRPTGSLHAMVLRKQTDPGITHVAFGARATRHWIGEDGKKVKAIRFTAPIEMLVKPEDCPREIPLKSGWGDRISRFFHPVPRPAIIVHEFGQLGVLIEEMHIGEREIAADLYFEPPEDF